jgi:hypothetical protein
VVEAVRTRTHARLVLAATSAAAIEVFQREQLAPIDVEKNASG